MLPSTLRLTLLLSLIVCYCHAQTIQICNDEPTAAPTHITPDCYKGVRIEAAGDPNCPTGEATVLAGDDINFFATESITLNAGFSTEAGATFRAEVVDNAAFACKVTEEVFCGVYIKPASAPPTNPNEPLYYDRFGNRYFESELAIDESRDIPLNCTNQNLENFTVFIEEYVKEDGTILPTTAQREVICAVMQYLDDLLVLPPTGSVASVKFKFDPALIASDIAGTGTSYFRNQCDIAYTILQEQFTLPNPIQPVNSSTALISLNPELNFYTELDLIPAIAENEYDLYTIILHEVLHTMGIGSQIGTTGASVEGYNTIWDLYLLSPNGIPLINTSSAVSECCLDYSFNQLEYPNMPNDILQGCGDVRFDHPTAPPVNGEYEHDFGTPPYDGEDNAIAINMLSHLDMNCGTEDYVMHYSISSGATDANGNSNIRRTLTNTEKDVLCELGYSLNNGCSGECILITDNDRVYVSANSDPKEIHFSEFLANDFLPDDFILEFPQGCQDNDDVGLQIDFTNEILIVDLGSPTLNGSDIFDLCYNITGCNGRLCKQENLRITRSFLFQGDNLAYSCAENSSCELICNGDFEAYLPILSTFHPQAGVPIFSSPINQIGSGTADVLFSEVHGNVAGFVNFKGLPNNSSSEVLYLPLKNELPDGCTATIQFDTHFEFPEAILRIFGFSGEFCETIFFEPNCNSQITNTNDCPNLYQFCIDEVGADINSAEKIDYVQTLFGDVDYPIEEDIGPIFIPLPINLITKTIIWTNNTGYPLSYLLFYVLPVSGDDNSVIIDNVSLMTDCQNVLTATPTVNESCVDGRADIDIQLCLTGPFLENAMATIEAELPNIAGLSFSDMNPDFNAGVAVVNDLVPNGNCLDLKLFVDIADNFSTGTTINIPLTLTIDNACFDPNDDVISFTTQQCCNQPVADFLFAQDDCSNSVQFTAAEQTFGSNHTWNFGDGTTSTQTNPSYNYTNAGTYTVSHTITNDCGNTNSYSEIITIANRSYSANFSLAENDCRVSFTGSNSDNITGHLWDFGDGTTSDKMNPNYSYNDPGTYTVTYTVFSDCGNLSTQQSVTVIGCPSLVCPCTEENNYNIDAGSGLLLSQSILPANGVSHACIAIKGKLIIDIDHYSITNSTLQMQAGAEIVIPQGLRSTIISCDISGCDAMWRGIHVEQTGRLSLFDCRVSDAQYALRLHDNVSVNVQNNTFDRNYVGIAVLPSSSTQNIGFSVPLRGNTFTCTSETLPPYAGQSPTIPRRWTYAGIQIANANFIVGSAGDPNSTNYFTNIEHGIIATNSTLGVYYVEMEHSFSPAIETFGIKSEGGITVANHNYFNRFGDNTIQVSNGYLAAEYNTIISKFVGILHQTALLGSFIRHNQIIMVDNGEGITPPPYGIWSRNPNTITKISNNTVHKIHSSHQGAAIALDNSFNNTNEEINDNNISTILGVGIRLTGARNTLVNNNTIEMRGNGTFLNNALRLVDTENSIVSNNTVFGLVGMDRFGSSGLRVIGSPNNTYCCNSFDHIYLAVSVDGFADDSKIRHSDMLDTDFGFICNTNTIIGVQEHAGNQWRGSYRSNAGAQHNGTEEQQNASQLRIQDSDLSTPELEREPPYWPPIQSLTQDPNWFTDITGQAPTCVMDTECDNVNLVSNFTKSNQRLSVYEYNRVATGTDSSSENAMLAWESDRHLFKKLVAEPNLITTTPELEQFYRSQVGTPLATFQEVETAIEELSVLTTSNLTETTTDVEEYLTISQQIKALDRRLLTSTEADLVILAAERIFLQTQQTTLANRIIVNMVEVQSIRKSAIFPIQSLNTSVLPATIFERNEKAVNQIYLETLAQGIFTLTSAQFASISSIAHQCVVDGGRGVLLARLLYQLHEPKIFVDDSCLDNPSVESRNNSTTQKNNAQKSQVLLFPNPNRGTFNLRMTSEELSETDNIYIQVFDPIGQLIHIQSIIPNQDNEIITRKLPKGIYYCIVRNGKFTVAIQKLIIIN